MIASQRHLFEIPDDIAYLNCAYMSPLMKPVVAASRTGLQRKASPWIVMPQDFFTESEQGGGGGGEAKELPDAFQKRLSVFAGMLFISYVA